MLPERRVVSIDCGGTRARGFWCCWASGRFGRIERPSRNFRSLADDALARLLSELRGELPEEFGGGDGERTAWLIGAAGGDPLVDGARVAQALQKLGLAGARVVVTTDYEANWAAALGGGEGLISVNGTGSVIYGRLGERQVRIGGWGYLFDSVPSGAALGRMAVQGLLAFWEGEREFLHFGEAWPNLFPEHPRSRDGLLRLIYHHETPQRLLGELAPLFIEAFRRGNPWARTRVGYALGAWCSQMGRAANELRAPGRLDWVGVGGLWQHWPAFRQLSLEALERRWPGRFIAGTPDLESAFGPLVLDLLRRDGAGRERWLPRLRQLQIGPGQA